MLVGLLSSRDKIKSASYFLCPPILSHDFHNWSRLARVIKNVFKTTNLKAPLESFLNNICTRKYALLSKHSVMSGAGEDTVIIDEHNQDQQENGASDLQQSTIDHGESVR